MCNVDEVIYFNNSGNKSKRNHPQLFGKGAFFDLDGDGSQERHSLKLIEGQTCVVASYVEYPQTVKFEWFNFKLEKIQSQGMKEMRVFYGDKFNVEEYPKGDAKNVRRYEHYFAKNGNFKRGTLVGAPKTDSLDCLLPEEVTPADGRLTEGAIKQIVVNAYERNARARYLCIAKHGRNCAVCGMSFGERYGPDANDYIHVHHLKPLSEMKNQYVVDPVDDLRPVCPNCHAVIHIGGANRSIKEVQEMLASQVS